MAPLTSKSFYLLMIVDGRDALNSSISAAASSSNSYSPIYVPVLSEIPTSSLSSSGERLLVRAFICAFYVCILAIGALMNVYVIRRINRVRHKDREQHRNGIGVCLYVMALADLTALLSLLMYLLLPVLHHLFQSQLLSDVTCKLILFLSHSAYSQSMWCWLLMSLLRYIAATRPLQYNTLRGRIPCTAMSIVSIGSLMGNAWMLLSTSSDGDGQCLQLLNVSNQAYRLFDSLLSFSVPTALVLFMDVAVLWERKRDAGPKHSDPMLLIVINRPNGEGKRVFHRFVLITISSLVLNVPENAVRLLAAFGLLTQPSTSMDDWMVTSLLALSQAMFFAQFAFNAFYLTTFVYAKSVLLSKTNSSRQLSMSFRHKIEEGSHMIRERASTISYRATTPLPQLAKISSCHALDSLTSEKHWL